MRMDQKHKTIPNAPLPGPLFSYFFPQQPSLTMGMLCRSHLPQQAWSLAQEAPSRDSLAQGAWGWLSNSATLLCHFTSINVAHTQSPLSLEELTFLLVPGSPSCPGSTVLIFFLPRQHTLVALSQNQHQEEGWFWVFCSSLH